MNDERTAGPPSEASAAQEAQTEPSDIEALRGIEAALTSLANDCKKAAERHLVRAAVGLIIGFVTALLLPVAFTLIDAFVDRQLADWKTQGAAAQAPTSEKIAADFAVVRDELSTYRNRKRDILRHAQDTRFGSVVFRRASFITVGTTTTVNTRAQQIAQCEGGQLEVYATSTEGRYSGVIGIGPDTRRYRGNPALVTVVDDNCILTPLKLPTISVREGFELEVERRYISLVPDGKGVAIPVSSNGSNSEGSTSRFLEGIIACDLNEDEATEGVFPCLFAKAPDAVRSVNLYDIRMNELGTGFGMIVDLAPSVSKLLYVEVDDTQTNENGLPNVRMAAKALDIQGRIDRILVKGGEAFLIGDNYSNPAKVLHLIAEGNGLFEPEVRDIGNIIAGRQYSVRDVGEWNGKAIALLNTAQDQGPILAFANASRLIPLFATTEPGQPAPIAELYVAEGSASEGTQLVLQRSSERNFPSPSIQQSVASAYSARVDRVAALFERDDTEAEPPKELEEQVFADSQRWEGVDVLIPDADRTTAERAQAIKPVLAAFTTAARSFDTIQESLQASRVQLTEAQQKVKDTESDIAFWSTIAARIVVIALIFYFVQLEMSLNRYNSRLSGHYRARALAMGYLLGSGQARKGVNFEDFLAAVMAIDSKEISSKDPPGPPTDKLLGALQGLVKSRGGSAT